MIKITFIMNSGINIDIVCEKFSYSINKLDGSLVEYKMEGIVGKKPSYIKLSEVTAILKEDIE